MGEKKEKFKAEEGRYNMCTAFREMMEEGRVLGFKQGKEQGVERGIQIFIMDNLEEGVSKERICLKLQRNFELNEEKAAIYFEKYSI